MSAHQPHLPQQVPIDAYGDGGFRFAGMRRRGSLLCLPSGLYAWRPKTLEDVTTEDLKFLFNEPDRPSFVLFGVGDRLAALPKPLSERFAKADVFPEPMDTGAACRTYNVLLAEKRPVMAALLQAENDG